MQYGPSILFNLLNSAKYISLTAKTSQDHKKLVLGCAIGENDQKADTLGRIVLIIVDPKFQQKNIGTELLSALETKLSNVYGIKSYELQVHYRNEKAIFFYQKNGYKISKKIRNYYDRKEHAYLMQKLKGG
ncbi:MAG: GNAT family N-acetyltransferase [Candidatus Hodarchaeales archaeon]